MNRQLLQLLLLILAACLVAGELHATIESCSGWALNKLPNLKSFLKDGEAESYRNVQVAFVPGRKAIMTIWEGDSIDTRDDWVEKEQIVLSDYKTKVWRLWLCCVECIVTIYHVPCNNFIFDIYIFREIIVAPNHDERRKCMH